MANNSKDKKRKKEKRKKRLEKYQKSQKLDKGATATDKKLGKMQIYLIVALMMAATAFIFYSMNK